MTAAGESLGVRANLIGCTWEALADAGLDRMVSPFSGPWCSRPDPSLALRDWGFEGSPTARWLPEVVRAHVAEVDPQPHAGYARRDAELALAARLAHA